MVRRVTAVTITPRHRAYTSVVNTADPAAPDRQTLGETPMFRTALASLFTLAAVAGFAAPAAAEEAPRQTDVAFYDLNVASPADARELLTRLENAAERVCSAESHGRRDLRSWRAERDCVRTAVRSAVRELYAPVVTAAYRGEAWIVTASR